MTNSVKGPGEHSLFLLAFSACTVDELKGGLVLLLCLLRKSPLLCLLFRCQGDRKQHLLTKTSLSNSMNRKQQCYIVKIQKGTVGYAWGLSSPKYRISLLLQTKTNAYKNLEDNLFLLVHRHCHPSDIYIDTWSLNQSFNIKCNTDTHFHRSPTFYHVHSHRWWHTTISHPLFPLWCSQSTLSPRRGREKRRALQRLCRQSPQELHHEKKPMRGRHIPPNIHRKPIRNMDMLEWAPFSKLTSVC